ncbi:putative CBL-interacting protein kinase 17 [Blattamonas nauphoetae]|uniref:non-specific serine/threonine protein kinase n=1 Tax=Blattamonas nauphoetae TaxID=2049346 RepID=A0ABQ9XJH0_9EUKA|nr:putative CBL-interacting protein kinase 17 [Blattamonas nauphoetae]
MASKLADVTPTGYIEAKSISEGAFGQVLKVRHERSGVEYAVKVLPMLKEGDKERVSREVEMLTRFIHPRIVRLHESIDMGGHQAIVMELGHRSLKDLIMECEKRKELIPLPLTVMILTDICEGLLWMHTHSSGSTAHGDLKPENVLLRSNYRAFLCDLGGSAPLTQQTSTIGELGTFEYNSPERMLDSKGTATPASDVWSLGVLAYRMVTGKSLFDGLHIFQMSVELHTFDETRVPTTIPSSVREVLLKMLEPNVALRATTTALFEGGLLERMLGSSTDLSRMKSIQLATLVNEIKELSNDAQVQERTMELSIEKAKLVEETKELKRRLRSLQMSLQWTNERNVELEKEEELEQLQLLLTTPTSPLSINPEANIIYETHQFPDIKLYTGLSDAYDISKRTITRTNHYYSRGKWYPLLFENPISEGVVSVTITILAMPKEHESEEGLLFGLADSFMPEIDDNDRLGGSIPGSFAVSNRGTLHCALPSIKHNQNSCAISSKMRKGDRVVLEVDMDARPRTAVFIINGNVSLTFVSGLPPSIQIGFSMRMEGVSIRFDGTSHLRQATPLRRVNEIKWNPEDLSDSEDMYMNGMRSSVVTVQRQMPSLLFTYRSHFKVEDNRIAFSGVTQKRKKDGEIVITPSSLFHPEPITEGIVAISFTYLDAASLTSNISLIDVSAPIHKTGQKLERVKNSIALNPTGSLHIMTSDRKKEIDLSSDFESCRRVVVEINMDSTPRTVQFFVDGQSANVVIVDLPQFIQVRLSAQNPGIHVRFDRITNLNRGSPITDQMKVFEWPSAEPLQAIRAENDGDSNQPSQDVNKTNRKVVDDGGEDVDEERNDSESYHENEDERADVEKKKRQFPTMKLPELLFTHKSHFIVRKNVLTRTEKGANENGRTRPSTVLLSKPVTKGVVSVTFVVLTLAESVDQKGFINFGLLDSSVAVPRLGQVLGRTVKHSVGLSTDGHLHVSNQIKLDEGQDSRLSKNARVVMEMNMDSNPRTVQFFVNGKRQQSYVSEIPGSVRIGFSADVMGTSLQIASIVHSTQPTPLTDKMTEIKWTDTVELFTERKDSKHKPIRREPQGSMPALVSRNPEHFKIEGNVIIRTAFDSTELNFPFATVMLDGVDENTIKSVAITILALPQTKHSRGVVMFGCLNEQQHDPKSPKGLGFGKKGSCALCSLDGVVYGTDQVQQFQTYHPPLKVGGRVVVDIHNRSHQIGYRFNVNGKPLKSDLFTSLIKPRLGISLAGPGTAIRIDAVTELDEPPEDENGFCSFCSLCELF